MWWWVRCVNASAKPPESVERHTCAKCAPGILNRKVEYNFAHSATVRQQPQFELRLRNEAPFVLPSHCRAG